MTGIRFGGERIRIASIDAPELPGSPRCSEERRAKAWCNYVAGYRAEDALRAFLSRGPVIIERMGPNKYGRTLAQVTVNEQDSGADLVGLGLGLARRWRRTVRISVCGREDNG
jgi:endonuclease YncB( thermonuclease family)